jgi:hypothetical protein
MAAIESGQLPALKLGNHVRISLQALENAAAGSATTAVEDVTLGSVEESAMTIGTDRTAASSMRTDIPRPERFEWIGDIQPAESFKYSWPQVAGAEPGASDERYHGAWRATINLNGHSANILLGEATRHGRGRLTVWIDGHPTAEFNESVDGQHWASLIRPNSRSVLRPGDPIPPLYRGTRVEPYRQITGLAGRGIPNGLAAVIARDDLRSAVHHAAARWFPRQYDGYVVRPARPE